MSLQNDLLDLQGKQKFYPSKKCRVAALYAVLPDEDGEIFRSLVEESTIPASHICEIMQRHGYDIGYSSVQRHRKRKVGSGCLCP